MATAKDLVVRPITRPAAEGLVRRVHYSGAVVRNSQIHLGVFLDDRLEGVMQFGPPLDKEKVAGLVAGTGWYDFLELNRMAFTDRLPRNSESRALGVALRLLRKTYPHLRWVISYADAAQCGDGTIYRAAGFVLTGIKRNNQAWRGPDGTVISRVTVTKGQHILRSGGSSMNSYRAAGYRPIEGYQLRYIYFLDPAARNRLAVPVLPFSEIQRRGASMYRGKRRAESIGIDATRHPAGKGRCDADLGAPVNEGED
jgi:hypothetical protein